MGRNLRKEKVDCEKKEGFSSWAEAVAMGKYRKMRAYSCPVCKGYHLTKWGG